MRSIVLVAMILGVHVMSADAAPATSATSSPSPATVTIDPAKVLGPVQRLVFGHNVEAADGKDIFSPTSNPIPGRTGDGLWDPARRRPVPEVLAMSKEIGVAMLRYPGGCLVHNFDWKAAVGPLKDRPNFTFGVDEFIEWCRAAGAEPLMNVSAYVGGPAEAGELVEYLNAPADAKHPWAQKRAACGHAEPYGVRYFEMGNESDHGNHDVKPFRKHTPESYAQWFNDCAALMRAVDPTIRIGALMGTGTGPGDPWNRIVATKTAGRADFIIVHTYVVNLWQPPAGSKLAENGDLLMRACMAVGDQTEAMLAEYRDVIRRAAGKDLPLAITEYNAAFVQDKPIPYRFSFGAALFSADYVRVLLKPQTNVLMANYWHLVNGYWGMVRGPQVPTAEPATWRKLPAFYLYRLWGRHFGPRLVDARVESPMLEFEGCLSVHPASLRYAVTSPAEFSVASEGGQGKGWRWQRTGPQSVTVTLEDFADETYLTLGKVAATAGATYRLTHEGRLADGGMAKPIATAVGVDMIDSRGWGVVHSGCATAGVESAAEWGTFRTEMVTQAGCQGLEAHLRLIGKKGGSPVSGKLELRGLRIEHVADAPPYAALTAAASVSQDAKTLYVIVFNKHHAEPITATLAVADGSARSARAWCVTGAALTCTNLKDEEVRETVTAAAVAEVKPQGFTYTFPPRSMTALEIVRQ
jgi:alpha-L-arabinofuranosidase